MGAVGYYPVARDSLFHILERRERTKTIMLTVYADESTDEQEKEVFAVGGLIGTQGEWDAIEIPWKARMDGKTFHASDLECGLGDFSQYDERTRHSWYADMVRIVAGSRLMGYVSVINLPDFWKVFPNVAETSPYFMCFQEAVIEFCDVASVYFPPEDDVKCIFDRNQKIQHNATVLFDKFSTESEWKNSLLLDDISFGRREKHVGIQAADLVAREAFKHRHNQMTSTRRTRVSMEVLVQTKRFRFRIWSLEALEELRDWALANGYSKNPEVGDGRRRLDQGKK